MLQAINEISGVKSKPTKDTGTKTSMLLDYSATYPNSVIQYHASYLVLHVDSDAAYLTIPEVRSFYAGNFYLSDWPSTHPVETPPKRNGRTHT